MTAKEAINLETLAIVQRASIDLRRDNEVLQYELGREMTTTNRQRATLRRLEMENSKLKAEIQKLKGGK